jgi:hypothetical protein
LLIIHNQHFFSLPAWLPKKPILGRNSNFIGSLCLLCTISLTSGDSHLVFCADQKHVTFWLFDHPKIPEYLSVSLIGGSILHLAKNSRRPLKMIKLLTYIISRNFKLTCLPGKNRVGMKMLCLLVPKRLCIWNWIYMYVHKRYHICLNVPLHILKHTALILFSNFSCRFLDTNYFYQFEFEFELFQLGQA